MKRIYLSYGLIAAFAVSLAACLFLIFDHEEGTHAEANRLLQENLAWELGQLQAALSDARIAVVAFSGGASDLDRDDVVLRFDVLRSRAQALRVGPGQEIIASLPAAGDRFDQMIADLDAVEGDILALRPGDLERQRRLDAFFRDIAPVIGQLVIDHLRSRSAASTAILATSRSQHQQVLILFAGSVLLAASLIVMLLLERRNSLQTLDTLQQRVEERTSQLRREEERLRGILDNMPSAIFLQDAVGRLALVNPVFSDWFGLAPDAAIGTLFQDLFADQSVAVCAALDRDVAASGEVREGEIDVRFANSEEHSLLVTKFPIFGPAGALLGIGTIILDITESKIIRQQLEQSEKRLNQAVQLAGLGYWVWDSVTGRCLYCSEENARIHGLSVDEYMALAAPKDAPFFFTHPDDQGSYSTALEALRHGVPMDMEYRLLMPDGEVRHVHEVAVAEFNSQNRVVREYGTIQDRTDLKLAQDRASQAKKMEAIGQLTGGVAHDFNNLIAIISGNAELLAESDSIDRSLVQPILRASQRGAELTHRLLAFSRRQSLHPQIVDLNVIVEEMGPLLDRALGEAIGLETDLCEDLWPISADPGQLENAILNLAINARDAMSSKGKLTITTTNSVLAEGCVFHDQQAVAGDYARLVVSDTGSGMSGQVVAKAFEPFFTTKGPNKGTGLGLSMVYGFAQQSGGFVALESVEGEGTSVALNLPREQSRERPIALVEVESTDASLEKPVHSREVVLIVDDNQDVLNLLEKTLSSRGYETFTAADARVALEILETEDQVQVLLSDVVLPGHLNGVELANRALARQPNLKIVLMSGYSASTIEVADAEEIGWPLLRKPFSNNELVRTLDEEIRARP